MHDIYIMNHNVAFIHIISSIEPYVILATAKSDKEGQLCIRQMGQLCIRQKGQLCI